MFIVYFTRGQGTPRDRVCHAYVPDAQTPEQAEEYILKEYPDAYGLSAQWVDSDMY